MKTEEINNCSASIVEIAINSNITLVVGLERTKLLVNSHVLTNASKVFNAMLGPHFREGQNIHGYPPKEISMPHDNADALNIICKILHLRNDSMPDTLTTNEVLQVAITADKFDCTMRLQVYTARWLNPGNSRDIFELGRLSAASYILKDARAFGQLTFAMISRHTESYIPLADEFIDHIPKKTFWLLEERGTVLRMQLEQLIVRGWYTHCPDGRGECDLPGRYAYAYIRMLHSVELWPMATVKMSISEAINVLEKTDNPTVSHNGIKCGFLFMHPTPDYKRERQMDLEEFKNSIGLCLDHVVSDCAANCSM